MMRDALRAGLTDIEALRLTLFGECRDQLVLGQLAVACVIRNRVKAGHWGSTFKDVCLAPAQFSCWWGADANTDEVYRIAETSFPNPQLQWIAAGVLCGFVRDDPSGGALNYLTAHLFETNPPTWAQHFAKMVTIGDHVFLTVA
jgi:N-acetylmuramoyl-L-alanine amidase